MSEEKNRINEIYTDRNLIILLLCVMNNPRLPRWIYGVHQDPEEPNWPVVIFELPTIGQISWHLHQKEAELLELPAFPGKWDGHTTEQKQKRIKKFLEMVRSGDVFRESKERSSTGKKTAAQLKREIGQKRR